MSEGFQTAPVTITTIGDIFRALREARLDLGAVSYAASVTDVWWPWTWRRHMTALGDRIRAVTAQLAAVEAQAPGAISGAIADAHAAGKVEGGGIDADAEDATTALEAQTGGTIQAIQAALPAPPAADHPVVEPPPEGGTVTTG